MVLRRFSRDETGAVLVEFLIVMPILLLFLFGIMQYGMYFLTYNGMQFAARDAARTAAVGAIQTTPALEQTLRDSRAGVAPWVRSDLWDVTGTLSATDVTVEIEVPSQGATFFRLPMLPMPDTLVVRSVMRLEQ